MITTIAACFGSLSRVDESSFHQLSTFSRSAALSSPSVLWGSSTTMMSPPNPSSEPLTEVASRDPPAVLSNCNLVFWSARKSNRDPHRARYQGLRMSRRIKLLFWSESVWLYEPHRNRTWGPERYEIFRRAQVHAGQQTEAVNVFVHRGGKLTNNRRIWPSVTACK